MAGEPQELGSLKQVKAREILDKIERGERVEYNGFIINGDIDIRKTSVTQENGKYNIKSPIRITHSQIGGYVDFNGSTFKERVDFKDCEFLKIVSFNKSIFKANVDFGYSTYRKGIQFTRSRFEGDASFRKSKFCEESTFRDSKFDKRVYFKSSSFKGDLNLNGTYFGGDAHFRNSNFKGKLNSNRSNFEGDAYFKESKFEGDVYFRESKFKQNADFSQSTFSGNIVEFESTHFVGDASFNDTSFKEKLSLSRIKYDKLYIRWKTITKPRYPWKSLEDCRRICRINYEDNHGESTYLLLIENFKKLGFFEDADNCYYYYRNERRGHLPILYKPFDLILMIFYGYGVKPIRPLIWAAIVFLAFGSLYTVYGEYIGIPNPISLVDALNMSYSTLLSGTKLIDNPNSATTGVTYFIFTVEKLLGSVFFALFLISVGRTIVR